MLTIIFFYEANLVSKVDLDDSTEDECFSNLPCSSKSRRIIHESDDDDVEDMRGVINTSFKIKPLQDLKGKRVYEADDDEDSYYTPSGVKQFKIRSVSEMFRKASQGSTPASARPTIPSTDHFDPAANFKVAPQVLPVHPSPFVPPPATVVAPIAKATPSANSGTPDTIKFSANPLPNDPNNLQLSRAGQPFQMVNDAVGLNTPQRYINNYGQLNMRLYDVITFQQVDLKTKELRRYTPNRKGYPLDIPTGYPLDIPTGYPKSPSKIPQRYPNAIPSGYPVDILRLVT